MTIKLTVESFLAGVRQSGLIEPDRLEKELETMRSQGVDFSEASSISDALIAREIITSWQAEKLLQGRHKGFLLGRYRLMSLLGKGEMSAVYLAEHIMMERRCAIKVLPANRVRDTSYLGRFHREARAVAALDHQNIVRAYDVDQQNEGGAEIHFLVMEYVAGVNLENRVENGEQLGIIEVVEYIRQAAEGLAHAHESGLVHRDIKPGNLLIDKKGTLKLLDLGLARFFNAEGEESLTIKHDEKVLGTADFLAPEQAIDSHSVDERADIYSLGCTLYFALTGHPPFTEGTLVQRLMAHQTKEAPSVKIDRPEVPDSLVKVLDKMMAKKKDDRYQTARLVADALAQWLLDNADTAWKKKNVNIVAQFGGLNELNSTKPTKSKSSAAPKLTDSGKMISPVRLTTGKSKSKKNKKSKKKEPVSTGLSSQQMDALKSEPVVPKTEPVKMNPFAAVKEAAKVETKPELASEVDSTVQSEPKSYTQRRLRLRNDSAKWVMPTVIALVVTAVVLAGFALYTFWLGL